MSSGQVFMFSAFLLLYVVTLSLTATATVPTLGYCWLLCGEVLILPPRAASSGHRCVTDPHTEFNIKPSASPLCSATNKRASSC